MARLSVATICGANRVTRPDGEALRDEIVKHWKDAEPLVLDFGGVVIASVVPRTQPGMTRVDSPRKTVRELTQVTTIVSRDRRALSAYLPRSPRDRS
jgi:hypothetical protein